MSRLKGQRSIIKKLDEILELSAIPEYRAGLLAKHEELQRIYREEIDQFLKDKYFGKNKKTKDFKFFRLQANSQTSVQNTSNWMISIENCSNPTEIFTQALINFILTHDVNAEKSVEIQEYITQTHTITFSFVRYSEVLVLGQLFWKPLAFEDSTIIRIVPELNWKGLSDDAKLEVFLEQFRTNKDIRNAILLYFSNYVYPYTSSLAV